MSDQEFDPSLLVKKKKKKTKSVAFAEEGSEPTAEENKSNESMVDAEKAQDEENTGDSEMKDAMGTVETSMENMFLDLKKKKKKKSKETAEDNEAAGDGDEGSVEDMAEFTGLKKKKKKPSSAESMEDKEMTEAEGIVMPATEFTDLPQDNDRDYTYAELLSRVFQIIHVKNPEYAGEKRKYTMVPPQVAREGSKKTVFINIQDICRRMRRQPEHLVAFLFAELGTQGSMDGGGRLVIKGRFQQKQMENVLKKYIVEYVTCKTCKSPDTHLAKENRLFFLKCETCASSRAVSAIKSGFRAQTEKRRKQA